MERAESSPQSHRGTEDAQRPGGLILGIETTCDETSAAVVRDGWEVLSNVVSSQIELHAKFGGVVPEVAARAHLECLDVIVAEALARAGVDDPRRQIEGVAVAHCPGLIGCLLVGTAAAKGYAFGWGKPLLGVNHVQAHLYSVVLGEAVGRGEGEWASGRIGEMGSLPPTADSPARPLARSVPFPAVGLVMSGGHSSLYHARGFEDLVRIGQTQDDAVGEAFDKVAAILMLGYPRGAVD